MKIKKEIKAAIMVISAIVLFVFGYNFLKGSNLWSKGKTMYAYYDNVNGLSTSSIVVINGFQIGRVVDISFTEDYSGKLKVSFNLDTDFKFGINSIAQIKSAGFIGGKILNIVLEESPSTFAENGTTLKSSVADDITDVVTSKIDPIQQKLNNVLAKTDVLLSSVNLLLKEENINTISSSLVNVKSLLSELTATSKEVNKLVINNKTKLDNSLTDLQQVLANTKTITDEVAQIELSTSVQKMNNLLDNFTVLSEKLNSEEGTVNKLLNDPDLYQNLENASSQLNMLLQDMKLHPKRYVHFSVFGKKEKEYEKPKDSLQ